MEFTHGTPCWMQVEFNDLDSGTEFFRRTAGWEIPPGDPAMGGYAIASIAGKPVSGIWPVPAEEPEPDAIDVWISVDNIESALARVKELGAEVIAMDGVEIQQVMELGKQVFLKDPSGAHFGLWEPITFNGIDVMMVPGSPFWFEHLSPDPATSAAFYANAFDLELVNHGDEYWTIKVPGAPADAYGFAFPQQDGNAKATWFVSLFTDDLDKSADLVRENGGTADEEFVDMGEMGRFTYATTPAGVPYGLWEANLDGMD